jgi:Lrp/AsnC family leucine-responsive transcriptional regulator
MDRLDGKILTLLQEDASLSHAELADRVNLSPSQCSRRIQRLEAEGVIGRHVVLVKPESLGLTVEAYVTIALVDYAKETRTRFHERIAGLESVVECCSLTGDSDYLLRIVSKDLAALTELINRDLLGPGDVAKVRSSIVLERIKRTTALPIA